MINVHFFYPAILFLDTCKNARLYIKMFIATVFIRTIYWKQSKCQSTNYWLNKFCILDYYTAINKTKGRLYIACTDMENIQDVFLVGKK